MADVLVARQPIFDRHLDAVGYELLFRGGFADQALVVDPEGATATVMLNSLTEIGVERLVGSKPAWINVSRDFIVEGYARLLPSHLFVVEVLEGQTVDGPLVAAARALRGAGHRLALDDFVYDETLEPLLELAGVVKVDLLALGRDRFQSEVERLRLRGVPVLAEKLETYEDYAFCAQLGCDLFQGYFFCRPQIIRGDRVEANKLSVLKLLASLQESSVELHDLERTIGTDPRLSYRLLRYINSAFFGLEQQVRSIGQAVALLGIENLTRWATLSLFTMIEDKPAELTLTALARARFCELAADHLNSIAQSEMFTVGLLSVLDALLDMPMTDALEEIPLAPDILAALIDHSGPRGQALDCVVTLEGGDLGRAEGLIANASALYVDAVVWADSAVDALAA
jgi:c-di-GMP phosphodiesterase